MGMSVYPFLLWDAQRWESLGIGTSVSWVMLGVRIPWDGDVCSPPVASQLGTRHVSELLRDFKQGWSSRTRRRRRKHIWALDSSSLDAAGD